MTTKARRFDPALAAAGVFLLFIGFSNPGLLPLSFAGAPPHGGTVLFLPPNSPCPAMTSCKVGMILMLNGYPDPSVTLNYWSTTSLLNQQQGNTTGSVVTDANGYASITLAGQAPASAGTLKVYNGNLGVAVMSSVGWSTAQFFQFSVTALFAGNIQPEVGIITMLWTGSNVKTTVAVGDTNSLGIATFSLPANTYNAVAGNYCGNTHITGMPSTNGGSVTFLMGTACGNAQGSSTTTFTTTTMVISTSTSSTHDSTTSIGSTTVSSTSSTATSSSSSTTVQTSSTATTATSASTTTMNPPSGGGSSTLSFISLAGFLCLGFSFVKWKKK